MMMKNNYIHTSFLLVFFMSFQFMYSQNKSDFDSILAAGTLEIYENPDKAIEIGTSVYENPSVDIKTKITSLMLISNGYVSKRDYQKSLEYIIEANKLSKQVNDLLLQIKTINRTAIMYHQMKIFDKAIQHLDEAEKLILSYPIKDSVAFFMGNNYVVRGFIYREKLNCDIAISFFDRGIYEYNKLNTINSKANSSIVYYNKGNCYILLSEFESAKKSFLKSIEMAKLNNANSLEAFALKGLAEVYTLEGKYEDAIETLNTGLDISKCVGDLILNQGLYKGLSENYLALNAWDDYQTYHSQYLETQLKVKQSERNSVSKSLDEIDKEQQLKLNEIRPLYYYEMIALLVINMLAIFWFFISYKKNKNAIFELKNDIENLQKIK